MNTLIKIVLSLVLFGGFMFAYQLGKKDGLQGHFSAK